jgi:hypothetical protein
MGFVGKSEYRGFVGPSLREVTTAGSGIDAKYFI